LLSQEVPDARQAAAADARQEEQPAEVTQQSIITTRGSWRQQAASSVRGRLRALAAKLLSKAAALVLAGLQVNKQSQLLRANPMLP
jgi:vacuolar-type H+-ATPase subunit H